MTRAKENPRPDADLMALLESSPQKGTEELFRRYAGLVWSVTEKYLDNPEDIKECVNDTFLEFYLHRERFQPEKGSLKTWLAAIARNLAVSRFRKNAASDAEEWKEDTAPQPDPFDNIEKKLDLEQAMEALPQEDAEIIRMKYYGGMTVEEIAASLGLPFETVKKRHQRSLKKLKRMLTLGLIITLAAALLAACAYLVLRYFGIVPGYGVVTDPEDAAYTLTEPVAAEGYYGNYTVRDVKMINGIVTIHLDITFPDEEILREAEEWENAASSPITSVEIVSGGRTSVYLYSIKDLGESDNPPAMLTWHMTYVVDDVLPPEDGKLILRFPGLETEMEIPMEPVSAEDSAQYGSVFHEHGGLLAVPKREDDRLLIELYPLNTGEYEISPSVIRGARMEGKTGDILLADEDGREYIGEQIFSGGSSFSTWDFGPVEPGTYTLRIPYVFLRAETSWEKSNSILINAETGQWEDKSCELPCGTVSVVSFASISREELPDYALNFMEGPSPVWRFVLRWEPPEEGLDMYYLPVTMDLENPHNLLGEKATAWAPEPLPDHCFELIYGEQFTDQENGDGAFPEIRLTPLGTQSIRWDCTFEIPMTVE